MSADLARDPILIEGWRFIPHSYAIVNQWQCLEMLRRGCRLTMRDLPYYAPKWKATSGLFGPRAEKAIAGIGPLPARQRAAAVLRISVPVRLRPSELGPTAVLCTADFGCLPRQMIQHRTPFREAIAGTDVRLLTPSNWARWSLLNGGAPAERIHVVPHGVNPSVFRPAPAERRAEIRKRLGWTGKFVFLNVSAMTTSKGIDLLLRAFADVASRNPDAFLALKGADDLYSSAGYVKHAMSGIGPETRKLVQRRTHYLGRTFSFRQLAQIYQAADAYVSPYRTESFNLPVLEAVATGLPVICTSGGPTDDFTTPDVALRIESRMVPHPRYEPEQVKLEPDVDHLTALMHRVMTDRALAETAGRCGPALVEERFTWRHAVDSLLRALGQS